MAKQLHTTVEEDAATRSRLAALSQRREAAAGERLQLEHRLKLQRLEQAKQMGALQVGVTHGSGSVTVSLALYGWQRAHTQIMCPCAGMHGHMGDKLYPVLPQQHYCCLAAINPSA